jgi:putative nucleotidyltransferase with HDIG domain
MAIPTPAQAEEILRSLALPDGIVVHSRGVTRVARAAAQLVADAGIPIDLDLVEAAALLHDLDKPLIRRTGEPHGLVAARQLAEMGYPELGPAVASHPVSCLVDDERFPRGWPSVIVAVADRHVAQEFMTIDQRIDDMLRRHPDYRRSLEAARRPAHALEQELADAAGLEPDVLVARLREAWAAGQ